jgi:membrane protease YdiL (CAAX protease family)
MESTPPRVRFTASPLPVAGAVAVVCLLASLSALAHQAVFGSDPSTYPRHLMAVLSLPFSTAVFLATWGLLRYEGVSAGDIGLDRSALLPGAVAFALLWALIAGAGVAYLTATGAAGALGASLGMPWYWVPVWFLLMLTLSNGLTEEFVFRGYVQSKCVALADARSGLPSTAVGIPAAALLFGVVHLPLAVILHGVSLRAVPWVLLNNLIPGVAYGLVYHLTRNLWYTGFVHGFANATALPFDPAAIPLFGSLATLVALLLALGYRRWGRTAGRVAVTRRTEVGSPGE